jgi:hypothetical protein
MKIIEVILSTEGTIFEDKKESVIFQLGGKLALKLENNRLADNYEITKITENTLTVTGEKGDKILSFKNPDHIFKLFEGVLS